MSSKSDASVQHNHNTSVSTAANTPPNSHTPPHGHTPPHSLSYSQTHSHSHSHTSHSSHTAALTADTSASSASLSVHSPSGGSPKMSTGTGTGSILSSSMTLSTTGSPAVSASDGLRRSALGPGTVRRPKTHAVVITGPPGAGKSSLILWHQAKWRCEFTVGR